MEYLNKLILQQEIKLANGNTVRVFELEELNDQMLQKWACHFRQTYCPDSKIDILRRGTGLSRKDYLTNRVFPDAGQGFGPATRLGDFAELLIADYLTYVQDFYVPKDRYVAKFNRSTSSQGTDVIGLKKRLPEDTLEDELIIIEVKAKATNNAPINRLQEAVDDVQKNEDEKVAVTLNAMKHRALDRDDMEMVCLVERFQNMVDNPFTIRYGAAAIQDKSLYDRPLVESTSAEDYVKTLLFINRKQLMNLVNELYEKAADIND